MPQPQFKYNKIVDKEFIQAIILPCCFISFCGKHNIQKLGHILIKGNIKVTA